MAEITQKKGGLSRRTITVICSIALAAVVITLLSYERIDILYVLASLSVVALLVIVATSKLEGEEEAKKQKV